MAFKVAAVPPLVVLVVLHFRRMAPRCPNCGRLFPY